MMTPPAGWTASNIVLRPAMPTDIPEIRALAELIWRASYATMLSAAQIDYMLAWMYGADTIAAEMAAGVLWRLAILEGRAVGYLSVTVVPRDTAELNKLYLLPALQGHGHGQALLGLALGLAAERGCRTVRLRVNKTNTRALQAYGRAGFERIDAVVADIGGGYVMDDFVLARRLDPPDGSTQPRHTREE